MQKSDSTPLLDLAVIAPPPPPFSSCLRSSHKGPHILVLSVLGLILLFVLPKKNFLLRFFSFWLQNLSTICVRKWFLLSLRNTPYFVLSDSSVLSKFTANPNESKLTYKLMNLNTIRLKIWRRGCFFLFEYLLRSFVSYLSDFDWISFKNLVRSICLLSHYTGL